MIVINLKNSPHLSLLFPDSNRLLYFDKVTYKPTKFFAHDFTIDRNKLLYFEKVTFIGLQNFWHTTAQIIEIEILNSLL